MSIAAMNWVWRQQLPPTPKLVLMSLGDSADDHGVCWPSVPTVARKCCVSIRTARRIMRELEASGRMKRDPRFRKDGSRTSNRYILALDGGDRLSGAPVVSDRTPGRGCPDPGDKRDSPGTTIESPMESPPPPPTVSEPAAPVAAAARGNGRDDDDCGGEGHGLREYPKGLSHPERAEARRKLAALPAELAQQVLDELAGRMGANTIRTTPLVYLRGLIERVRADAFTPELALQIAERRQRRRQNEAALRQAETAHRNALLTKGRVTSPTQDTVAGSTFLSRSSR